MVNLLGRRGRPAVAPRFDARALDRIEARLATLFGLARSGGLARVARVADGLGVLLEELDAAPSRLAVEDLLEALDGLRDEAFEAAVAVTNEVATGIATEIATDAAALARDGGFVGHRPGRSLTTGEAEIASRGYFDAADRPPIATWLGVLDATADGVEDGVWIVAWVEPEEVERARAGCRASPNGTLAWLDDVSAPAVEQLLERARAAARARSR